MTFISREEALAREERREAVMQKHSVDKVAHADEILNELAYHAEVSPLHGLASVNDVFEESGPERIADFLVATEPTAYIPGHVEPSHERTRAAYSMSNEDCRHIVIRHFTDTRFPWLSYIPAPNMISLQAGLAHAMAEGIVSPVVEFFKRNPIPDPYPEYALIAALNACGDEVSPMDIPHYGPAKGLFVPTMSEIEVAARNRLSEVAAAPTTPVFFETIHDHVTTCVHAASARSESVERAVRLELSMVEMNRRRPIYETLTSRGVPKIIARELTNILRKEDRVEVSDEEAGSYARGWHAMKTSPAPLVASLLGVHELVAESALLAEKLSEGSL